MIFLSGGHYPRAAGATRDGRSEYPTTLEWATRIATIFNDKHSDYTVGVVPPGTLPEKVRYINRGNPRLAVEIHFNAGGGRGCETLYYPGSRTGLLLAETIQRSMAAIMPPNRGVKEGWYQMDRPGIADYAGDVDGDEKPDYFLAKTRCPAVIVEPEFVERWGVIDANKEFCCEIIADAIYEYVTREPRRI